MSSTRKSWLYMSSMLRLTWAACESHVEHQLACESHMQAESSQMALHRLSSDSAHTITCMSRKVRPIQSITSVSYEVWCIRLVMRVTWGLIGLVGHITGHVRSQSAHPWWLHKGWFMWRFNLYGQLSACYMSIVMLGCVRHMRSPVPFLNN